MTIGRGPGHGIKDEKRPPLFLWWEYYIASVDLSTQIRTPEYRRTAPLGSVTGGCFDAYAARYDAWYDSHVGRAIFATEVAYLRPFLRRHPGPGLEIGVGTGRFAQALGVEHGIDPARSTSAVGTGQGHQGREGQGRESAVPGRGLWRGPHRFDSLLRKRTCTGAGGEPAGLGRGAAWCWAWSSGRAPGQTSGPAGGGRDNLSIARLGYLRKMRPKPCSASPGSRHWSTNLASFSRPAWAAISWKSLFPVITRWSASRLCRLTLRGQEEYTESRAARAEEDHHHAHEADGRADHVRAIRPEAVENPPPEQGEDNEHAPISKSSQLPHSTFTTSSHSHIRILLKTVEQKHIRRPW